MADSEILYEKTLFRNEDKGFELRLVVNEFRNVQYIHIRKYFLSFDEGYIPSKEGASMPASINNIYALLDGLIDICSKEEGVDAITKHFSQRILDLKTDSV